MSQPPGNPAKAPGDTAADPMTGAAEMPAREQSLAILWIRFDTMSRTSMRGPVAPIWPGKCLDLTGAMGARSLGISAGVAQGLERRSHNP
jgi:hypothetical protein